jgi:DNA-binding protein H-NS
LKTEGGKTVKQKAVKMASINVDKMSLKELVDLEAKVKKALAAARDKERGDLKRKMAEMAENHGFSVAELFGGGRGKGAAKGKSLGVAKYANPENKSDTWTGRGRKPNWLLERMKKGSKLADFEI